MRVRPPRSAWAEKRHYTAGQGGGEQRARARRIAMVTAAHGTVIRARATGYQTGPSFAVTAGMMLRRPIEKPIAARTTRWRLGCRGARRAVTRNPTTLK